MNQLKNRLNASISAANLSTIKTKLAEISDLLPFLVGLKPEEKQALPKINEVNKVFVEDAITAIENNPEVLPPYLKPIEIKSDLALYQQLDELKGIIDQLYQKIIDSQTLAGSEAYVSSLTAYRLFDSAANAGMPGMQALYDNLKGRFSGQGSSPVVETKPAE
jgi:hypothetical protein